MSQTKYSFSVHALTKAEVKELATAKLVEIYGEPEADVPNPPRDSANAIVDAVLDITDNPDSSEQVVVMVTASLGELRHSGKFSNAQVTAEAYICPKD